MTRTIEGLLARSAVYHALSVLLRHPDAETGRWLTTQAFRRLPEVIERLASRQDGSLRGAFRRLTRALERESVAEWARVYERVFGHIVQGMAPPYELEYGERHSHRQPQELGDIGAFYQAFGLRVASAAHERVDHISTECEFMQVLLYKQAAAMDADESEPAGVCAEAATQFLADHLGRWGPAFALRLSRAVDHGVLSALADALSTWLVWDCAHQQAASGPRELPLRLPKEREEVACAACAAAQTGSADGAPA